DGGLAPYPAMHARLSERAQVVRQSREHVAAVAPEILLGVRQRSIQARRDLVGGRNRLVEGQGGLAQLVTLARGLARRDYRAHHVGIVEAQLRRALDGAVGGGHLGGASRVPAGGSAG